MADLDLQELMQGRVNVRSQQSFPLLCSDQPFPEHLMVRLSQIDEELQAVDFLHPDDERLESREQHHRHHRVHRATQERRDATARRHRGGDIDLVVEDVQGMDEVGYWDTVRSRCLLASKLNSFLTPRPDSRTVSTTMEVSRAAPVQPSQDHRTRHARKKVHTFPPPASNPQASSPPPGEAPVLDKSGSVKLILEDQCKDQHHEKSHAVPRLVAAAHEHRSKSATARRSALVSDFRRTSHLPPEGQLVGLTSYYHLMQAKFPNVRAASLEHSRASSLDHSAAASAQPRNYINRACSDPLSTLLGPESARVPSAKTALLLRRPASDVQG